MAAPDTGGHLFCSAVEYFLKRPLLNSDNDVMISSTLSKNLLAVCAGILLFLVLEGILALAGVPRLADEDRFVGFTGRGVKSCNHILL
ncbi:hypothetical protein [Desulfuromonas sp. DDH964]|uniref:hypothetical protein n=1 Tax=Desulfuromonas sp. DDH964 TaxID=1823759 RepID=UPI0012F89421|nr:hypothetical protein [Desulfuromonas sp. DDH964]